MSGPSQRAKQSSTVVTPLTGYLLLNDHLLNKGTAFTDDERTEFELHGLLPPTVATLDQQVSRRLAALRGFATDLERYAFLRDLQDTNETLFHALLVQHIEELLPIVYTPTVGAAASTSAACSASRAACSSACRIAPACVTSWPIRSST